MDPPRGGDFDGFADFELAVRDPEQPTQMLQIFNCSDGRRIGSSPRPVVSRSRSLIANAAEHLLVTSFCEVATGAPWDRRYDIT